MTYVDEFLKAERELRQRQEEAVRRQSDWDKPRRLHLNGRQLLRIFLFCLFWAGVAGAWVWSVMRAGQ
jgi:hypothetical protein